MRPIDGDKLKKDVLKWLPSDPCGIEEKEFPFETDIVVSLLMEIEEAPTIEQPTWIPCSERLPDETGFYLCTVNRDTPNVKTMKFEWLVGDEYRWMLMNGTEAFPRFVIAWMPLPPAWKGADDDN